MHAPDRPRRASLDGRLTPGRILAAALLLLASASCGRAPEPQGPPPDVVLIVIDTLRADRLGSYGYPRPTSPVLDALAAEGVLFEDVTAQASWTLVSMSSLWTGRYVTQNLQAPVPTWPVLAETFQRAGYVTIGSSANPLLSAEAGFERGFDAYRSYGELLGRASAEALIADLWEPIDAALAGTLPGAHAAGEDGRRAPLFLYLQPLDPHTPYRQHPDLDERLPLHETVPLAPEGWHEAELARHGPPAPAQDPDWARALWEMHLDRGRYDQEVAFTDRELGKLLAGLRRRGLLDNAIVVIASDHGEGLYDKPSPLQPELRRKVPPNRYFFVGHGYTLFQEGIFTPLILWGRGVPAGVRVAEAVENIDIFPTLLQLAGLKPEGPLDGHSLVGLMHGREREWRSYSFSYIIQNAAVHDRVSGYKLVQPTAFGRRRGMQTELFHLPSDPLERTDLAEREPEVVRRLSEVLEDWYRRHPVPSIEQRSRSPEELQLMRALGYTGDHSPDLEEAPDPPPERPQ